MSRKRVAILISGRGSNMEAILRNVQKGRLQDCCEVALVFANRGDAKGVETARGLGIETAYIESRGCRRREFDRQVVELLEPYALDYLVLAGYMRILSPVLVERYPRRIINIHPADTAAYQGAHAYEWAFDQRLSSTMITVHFVDEGVDTGPVIGQAEVDLTGAATLEEIEQRGLAVEHRVFSELLRKVFTAP